MQLINRSKFAMVLHFRCITISLLLLSNVAFAQKKGFNVDLTILNRVELSIDGGVPEVAEASTLATLALEGTEKSECEDYGRKSAASGSAETIVSKQTADRIDLSLSGTAYARGGHFRTCLLGCSPPIFGLIKCLGVHGNDTSAKTASTASAILTISFDPDFPPTDYEFDFSSDTLSPVLVAELKDGAGNLMPLRRPSGDPQILRGKPGAVYLLAIKLPVTAADIGMCCSAFVQNSTKVSAGIRIQRAPILDAKEKFVPYISGGAQTTAYPYVGAIKIDNRNLCTGTLIGPTTVLTAAHCVSGFEERLKESGVFIIGSNITQPDETPIAVIDYKIREDYNPTVYENDIALVYLKSAPISGKIVSLHKGMPTWDDLISKKMSLTFVGFGYDVDDGQQVGRGIKREASWFMSSMSEKTVSFPAADKGTCKGDSGGPALLVESGKTLQVAVTSGSLTNSCKDGGIETRVDYFQSWLAPKIR